MSPEDLDRVKAAHAKALRLPPEQRAAFLQTEFGDSSSLYEQLGRLLEWHKEAGEFLNSPLSETFLDPAAGDFLPRRIGPWQLTRELGRGGSATVYLAHRADDLFEKQVAIKVINRLSSSPAVFARFRREIQILARLDHPSIVRFLEAGTTGEALAYIVTEFVDGQPIDVFASGLSLSDKLSLFLKVCDGVSSAHDNLIVHRDLKPSNILVGPDGTPKLLDFGIALLLQEDSRLTETGLERMTIRYASPEQVRRSREITVASDIYSLGVMLYEFVAGHSPYGEASEEAANWILFKDPLPVPGVARGLDAIVRTAMHKDPGKRYSSVRGLRDDLTRFQQGDAVWARKQRLLGAPARFLRRHRWRVGLTVAGAVLALLAAAWYYARSGANRYTPITLEAPEGRPLWTAFNPEGTRLYYLAGEEFFDFADLFAKDLATGKTIRLTADGTFKLHPAVSPDGRLVAFQRAAGERTTTMTLIGADGGEERRLFTAPSGSFTWGRDARSLIVSVQREDGIWPRLQGFNIDTNEWWDLTSPPKDGRGDHYPVLSPDGRSLCFVRQESREAADLFLLPLDDRLRPAADPSRLTSKRLRVRHAQWSPDGKEIIFEGGTLGRFRIFRVAADYRSEPKEMAEVGSGIDAFTVSQRNRRMVAVRSRTETNIWRLRLDRPAGKVVEGRLIQPLGEDAKFSPDDRRIAFVSERSGEPQVWIADADGLSPRRITSFPAPDGLNMVWLPDSSGLVVNVRSRSVGLRSLTIDLEGRTKRELSEVQGYASGFSRDGKWLYFSRMGNDIDIFKYSLETDKVRRVTWDLRASYAAESPDGRTIYIAKPEAELGLWKLASEGRASQQVLPNLARRTLFTARPEGIYYVERASRSAVLKARRFSDGSDQEIYRMKVIPAWGLSLSADGLKILLSQQDVISSETLLIDGFH